MRVAAGEACAEAIMEMGFRIEDRRFWRRGGCGRYSGFQHDSEQLFN